MFIYNQIIICQEIIGSQPSVLCTNGKVYQKIDFQLVRLFRSGIMRKNIFVTHNHYVYSLSIYIYIRPYVVHVPLTRYAQTSDWPVEVQRSI